MSPPPENLTDDSAAFGESEPSLLEVSVASAVTQDPSFIAHRGVAEEVYVIVPFAFALIWT